MSLPIVRVGPLSEGSITEHVHKHLQAIREREEETHTHTQRETCDPTVAFLLSYQLKSHPASLSLPVTAPLPDHNDILQIAFMFGCTGERKHILIQYVVFWYGLRDCTDLLYML